jgi:sec-independent protein translocase protein TatA
MREWWWTPASSTFPGMRLGMGEMLVIRVVVLLVFGPNKLPQLGDSLGRGIRNLKKAATQEEPAWEDSGQALAAASTRQQAAVVKRTDMA